MGNLALSLGAGRKRAGVSDRVRFVLKGHRRQWSPKTQQLAHYRHPNVSFNLDSFPQTGESDFSGRESVCSHPCGELRRQMQKDFTPEDHFLLGGNQVLSPCVQLPAP